VPAIILALGISYAQVLALFFNRYDFRNPRVI